MTAVDGDRYRHAGDAAARVARTARYPVEKVWTSQMRHNRLRALLTAGEPTIGTHLLSTWPTLVELVGHAGNYDYVEFTAEYSPFDMHDLDNLGRALELKNLGGMIKIEQTQWTHQAMRAIGSGFQSVLFADLRTVADARGLRRRGTRRDAGNRRPARRRHAARRGHRARRWLPRLCRGAQRGRDRRDGREARVRRGPRCDPVGQGPRHGAVRRLGLFDEPGPDRPDATTRTSRRRSARPSRPR